MKFNTIYSVAAVAALAAMTSSCNDFLDELPDNRSELNTEEKIESLLVSAYPTSDPIVFAELMSDNADDMGESVPYTTRYLNQCYEWVDITENSNSDPEDYWNGLNSCIETANTALEAIDKMPSSPAMKAARAEALLCRAFATFLMVNYFAPHYDAKNTKALGVSSIRKPETELNPKYERATVIQNYADIQADLEAALPEVSELYYKVPKYHFTQKAAYAFACRFYLYTEQWQKSVDYADKVLGTNASAMLRDYAYLANMTVDEDAWGQHYVSPTVNANLMLLSTTSVACWIFGNVVYGKRFVHSPFLSENETVDALAALWGGDSNSLRFPPSLYPTQGYSYVSKCSLPKFFEVTNPTANTGFVHTVYNAFTADEILLNRAEAYAMLKQYDKSAADLNIWMHNAAEADNETLTPEKIQQFFNALQYSYSDDKKLLSSPKKHLHPKFSIDSEGSVQESLLQCVLAMRRYETLHEGKRWLDIKRYGIEIPRRLFGADGKPAKVTDWMSVDDPRRAIQIPLNTISAGYTPNPR